MLPAGTAKSALMIAANAGSVEAREAVAAITAPKSTLPSRAKGQTALMWAAAEGHPTS